uniref:ATP-dependent DNA ligase n=1 Tax=Pseudomonas sp. TE3-3-F2023 TaxID=3119004 RepID=UPI00403F4A52
MQPPTVPCPERIAPQLVTLVGRPPAGAWRYEIKYDGYRMLARIDGSVQLLTKNGYDWTDRMPLVAADLARMAVHSAWLDGEVVVQDDDGRRRASVWRATWSRSRRGECPRRHCVRGVG